MKKKILLAVLLMMIMSGCSNSEKKNLEKRETKVHTKENSQTNEEKNNLEGERKDNDKKTENEIVATKSFFEEIKTYDSIEKKEIKIGDKIENTKFFETEFYPYGFYCTEDMKEIKYSDGKEFVIDEYNLIYLKEIDLDSFQKMDKIEELRKFKEYIGSEIDDGERKHIEYHYLKLSSYESQNLAIVIKLSQDKDLEGKYKEIMEKNLEKLLAVAQNIHFIDTPKIEEKVLCNNEEFEENVEKEEFFIDVKEIENKVEYENYTLKKLKNSNYSFYVPENIKTLEVDGKYKLGFDERNYIGIVKDNEEIEYCYKAIELLKYNKYLGAYVESNFDDSLKRQTEYFLIDESKNLLLEIKFEYMDDYYEELKKIARGMVKVK